MMGPSYLEYPLRGHNLDHDRFPMRYLAGSPPVTWPSGAKLALWITVHVEFFPMNMGKAPFVPAGGIEKPYPSHWDFATRDYGSRIGIYRIMKVLEEAGIKASAAVNAEIARRYPALFRDIVDLDWEIIAAGTDMGELISGNLNEDDERRLITSSLAVLREGSGQDIIGWHSPGYSQSFRTPDLLTAQGIRYATDWVNDDMPYRMDTKGGALIQMPLTWFMSDQHLLMNQHQHVRDFERQIGDAADCLLEEAERTGSGRILSLALTPYVIGQPYRIAALKRLLADLTGRRSVWFATGAEIAGTWSSQVPA